MNGKKWQFFVLFVNLKKKHEITLLVKKININRSINSRHFCATSTVNQNANSSTWWIWPSVRNMCYSQQRCLWLTLLWSLMMMNVIIITTIIFIIIITTKPKFSNLIDYNYLSLISALIGQCNRKVRVITRALQRLFFTLLETKTSEILVVWLN